MGDNKHTGIPKMMRPGMRCLLAWSDESNESSESKESNKSNANM